MFQKVSWRAIPLVFSLLVSQPYAAGEESSPFPVSPVSPVSDACAKLAMEIQTLRGQISIIQADMECIAKEGDVLNDRIIALEEERSKLQDPMMIAMITAQIKMIGERWDALKVEIINLLVQRTTLQDQLRAALHKYSDMGCPPDGLLDPVE